jgi:hypothetical protein
MCKRVTTPLVFMFLLMCAAGMKPCAERGHIAATAITTLVIMLVLLGGVDLCCKKFSRVFKLS